MVICIQWSAHVEDTLLQDIYTCIMYCGTQPNLNVMPCRHGARDVINYMWGTAAATQDSVRTILTEYVSRVLL